MTITGMVPFWTLSDCSNQLVASAASGRKVGYKALVRGTNLSDEMWCAHQLSCPSKMRKIADVVFAQCCSLNRSRELVVTNRATICCCCYVCCAFFARKFWSAFRETPCTVTAQLLVPREYHSICNERTYKLFNIGGVVIPRPRIRSTNGLHRP